MSLKKYEIKTYATKDLYERVNQEATARRTTMARIMRDGLSEYFLLREEMANAISNPGTLGENHTGKIIHTLLARSEERLLLGLENIKQLIIRTQKQQEALITMLDQFYLDLMQFFPSIPRHTLSQAKALAIQRHQEWLTRINNV